jgi:hypothetical protein
MLVYQAISRALKPKESHNIPLFSTLIAGGFAGD